MSAKTEAELALQRKYEALRKKKEEKARQQANKPKEDQQTKSSAGLPGLQKAVHAPASKSEEVAPAKALTPHEKALQALKRSSKGDAGKSVRPAAPSKVATQQRGIPGTPAEARQPGPSSGVIEDANKPKLSPMEAAKQALAAKSKQSASAGARKLPGVKRPMVKRLMAPPASQAAREDDAADNQAAKRQRTSDGAGPSGREEQQAAPQEVCLFVGDLPPFFRSEDLEAVFSQLARVTDARVMGSKLFGFVTVESEAAAAYILETSDTLGIFAGEGQPLRVSRAHDGGSDWQRGTGGDSAYHAHTPGGQVDEGYNPYEHPKVREARLAARSLADQIDLQQLPGMDCGPPPERPLVCYDDL
ncbi:g7532 [Coccomyxa elongata]